jgi:NAD(P)-dependent dehydrogenase (short-subunit alcohol dehydrogenase family)
MLLKDKIAVVYGAGGGIGSAIARKFALSNPSHPSARIAATDFLNRR